MIMMSCRRSLFAASQKKDVAYLKVLIFVDQIFDTRTILDMKVSIYCIVAEHQLVCLVTLSEKFDSQQANIIKRVLSQSADQSLPVRDVLTLSSELPSMCTLILWTISRKIG
jgi:hypothetical protein